MKLEERFERRQVEERNRGIKPEAETDEEEFLQFLEDYLKEMNFE